MTCELFSKGIRVGAHLALARVPFPTCHPEWCNPSIFPCSLGHSVAQWVKYVAFEADIPSIMSVFLSVLFYPLGAVPPSELIKSRIICNGLA